MTPRQRAGVASMIVDITEGYRCILEIENDEVTVYDGHHRQGAHSHHRGENLYDRVARALETAREYAAEREKSDLQFTCDGGSGPTKRPAAEGKSK